MWFRVPVHCTRPGRQILDTFTSGSIVDSGSLHISIFGQQLHIYHYSLLNSN